MQDRLEGVFNFSYNAWRNLSLVFTLHFLATLVFFFFYGKQITCNSVFLFIARASI